MRNSGLEEAQAGIKIARRNINNLRYADDTFDKNPTYETYIATDAEARRIATELMK